MPVYPGTEQPHIKQATTIERDGFAEKLLTFYSHTGTHIDAPAHILSGNHSLDQFNTSKFIGNGLVIDVKNCNCGIINKEYLQKFETGIHGAEFILFYSGWADKWGSDEYFDNFPVLSSDAAKWLCTFSIKGVGYDCISADPVTASELPNHRILLGNDMVIIENLCNLQQLVGQEFLFSCLPLKIEDSDGSPVRAVGITFSPDKL